MIYIIVFFCFCFLRGMLLKLHSLYTLRQNGTHQMQSYYCWMMSVVCFWYTTVFIVAYRVVTSLKNCESVLILISVCLSIIYAAFIQRQCSFFSLSAVHTEGLYSYVVSSSIGRTAAKYDNCNHRSCSLMFLVGSNTHEYIWLCGIFSIQSLIVKLQLPRIHTKTHTESIVIEWLDDSCRVHWYRIHRHLDQIPFFHHERLLELFMTRTWKAIWYFFSYKHYCVKITRRRD